MKKCVCLICLLISLSACKERGRTESQLLAERDSLMNLNDQQRKVLDDMTLAVVEFTNILDTINMQEKILFATHDIEGHRYSRRQIVENLRTFENILQEKRMRIHYLDSLMDKGDERVKRLSSLVRYLNEELDKKDITIKRLQNEIRSKNFNINALNERIATISSDMEQLSDSLSAVTERSSDMQSTIDRQNEELYTIYYVIGTKKELKAKGVLVGGRLFKSGSVNPSALSVAHKADYRELESIPIEGGKPNILTDMPEGSYKLTKISDKKYRLEIVDKKQFWKVSKLLVIQVR